MTPPRVKSGAKPDGPAHECGMEAVVPHLVELGLTRHEARVYAALVVKGESEAGVIRTASEVPHSAVYGTLKRLESRGLVERSAGSPARFRAVPPTEVLRRTRDEMHCAAAAALKGLRHLRQSALYARSRTLWIAEGRGHGRNACPPVWPGRRRRSSSSVIPLPCGGSGSTWTAPPRAGCVSSSWTPAAATSGRGGGEGGPRARVSRPRAWPGSSSPEPWTGTRSSTARGRVGARNSRGPRTPPSSSSPSSSSTGCPRREPCPPRRRGDPADRTGS